MFVLCRLFLSVLRWLLVQTVYISLPAFHSPKVAILALKWDLQDSYPVSISVLSFLLWLCGCKSLARNFRKPWSFMRHNKAAPLLRLCLFHCRLRYVSVSVCCRPRRSAAHSSSCMAESHFIQRLVEAYHFKMLEFLPPNGCANSRLHTYLDYRRHHHHCMPLVWCDTYCQIKDKIQL